MTVGGKLFAENKFCSWCHCPLPSDAESDYCQACEKSAEFRKVREYVRENIVNEFELANAFGIPLRQVKKWIREGRLEYREVQNVITSLTCEKCGKHIQFGNFCPECNHQMHGIQGGFQALKEGDDVDHQMRFHKKENK